MPTLCLPSPGTQASVLFRKQIVSGRQCGQLFPRCFPIYRVDSPLHLLGTHSGVQQLLNQ